MDIKHQDSQQYYGLQTVGLFSWGIFRKYEKKDSEWFEIFSGKVAFRNNTYKTNLSVPYRLLVSRLIPAYGREYPEQPITDLPLI